MNNDDKALGMDRDITRRDVLVGAAALGVGVAAVRSWCRTAPGTDGAGTQAPHARLLSSGTAGAAGQSSGLVRGCTRNSRRQDIDSAVDLDEHYNLVVVGAGLAASGGCVLLPKIIASRQGFDPR